MLPLPRIDPAIPFLLRTADGERVAAQAARLLVDAGALHRRDLREYGNQPLQVVERALNRWLHAAIGQPLRLLACPFAARLEQEGGQLRALTISWYAVGGPSQFLGPALEAIEKGQPGMGASILKFLHRQRLHPLYTPLDAFDWIVVHEWMGEDDERGFLEQACATDVERVEVLQQIVTREMVDETYPPWVLRSLHAPMLAADELARTASAGGHCGPVAAALLRAYAALHLAQAAHAGIKELALEDENSNFSGCAKVLAWDAADTVTKRVYDDEVEHARNYRSHTDAGCVSVTAQRPDDLRRFLKAMRFHFQALHALDHLLDVLSAGQ